MRTALVAIALLAFAGPALADDLANADASATVLGVDPALDGTHTVSLRVYTDDAGSPGAELLVDGASVLP